MDNEKLSLALADQSVRFANKKGQLKAIKEYFSIYCKDVAPWVIRLAQKVKKEHLIGYHPFMLCDFYTDDKDKCAAVLLSAAIPVCHSRLSLRLENMYNFIGSNPYLFIKGSYKIRKFPKRLIFGCSGETLQIWCDILNRTYKETEPTRDNAIQFLNILNENIQLSGLHLTANTRESLSEAVFWLMDGILHTDGSIIPMPNTKAIRDFIRAFVPRSTTIGLDESVRLFGFEYPYMVWYAAQGRKWLYNTNYDGIYMLEHNLRHKFIRHTPMSSYERWRFRKSILSKVSLD